MRSFFALIVLGLLAGPAKAQTETIIEPAPDVPSVRREARLPQTSPLSVPEDRLDRLYGQLKRERNERAAQRLARLIRDEWTKSGSASIDLMMQWSQKAMDEKKFDIALDFLDQVTLLEPDFVEGWNRRATIHFMMDAYPKAMSDIRKVLELEPRHFGALAGMAAIFKAYDRKQAALDAYSRVLAVYPTMRSAQQEVGRLADELAGEAL